MNLKIAICVTFFYRQNREKYILEVIDSLLEFSIPIDLTVISNNITSDFKNVLRKQVYEKSKFNLSIFSPIGLGHPFLLAWSHYSIFEEKIKDNTFTHFIYLEDDIKFTEINFNYWVKAREQLKNKNAIPAFFRYEINTDLKKYSTDVLKKMSIYDCNIIDINQNTQFINIVYPYQAMYLYDKQLMLELLNSPCFNPDYDHGIFKSIFPLMPFNIREKAALGLTFVNNSSIYRSRVFLPFDKYRNQLENDCLVHHISNNYTLDHLSLNGRIEVEQIFKKKSLKLFFAHIVKKILKSVVRFILNKSSQS